MPVGNAGADSFFDKYTSYTKDGKINQLEYQELKRSYMSENNASEEDFNRNIAPAIDSYVSSESDSINEGARDLIAMALQDGKLTFAEYTNIKDYYMQALGISGEVFDDALDYIIRKEIIAYIKENQDQEVEVNITPSKKTIMEALEESIQKAILRSISNGLVKMRTQDEFSEYTYRVLKSENNKTAEKAEEV